MRPGGWIELQDMYLIPSSFDGTHEGTAWQGATLAAGRGLASLGKDLYKVLHYAEWLKEVGFVDIRWDAIPWPIGAWPKDKKWKEIGRYSILNSVDVLESIRKLVELSGLSKEETQEMIEQGKREVKDPAMHGLVKL
jgi:hypothetical protein